MIAPSSQLISAGLFLSQRLCGRISDYGKSQRIANAHSMASGGIWLQHREETQP